MNHLRPDRQLFRTALFFAAWVVDSSQLVMALLESKSSRLTAQFSPEIQPSSNHPTNHQSTTVGKGPPSNANVFSKLATKKQSRMEEKPSTNQTDYADLWLLMVRNRLTKNHHGSTPKLMVFRHRPFWSGAPHWWIATGFLGVLVAPHPPWRLSENVGRFPVS